MTTVNDAMRDLLTAKLAETIDDLGDQKVDSLAMVQVLGSAFLNVAASCAPNRDEFERVTDELMRVRWEVWDHAHPN